jgi:hypothetical protein
VDARARERTGASARDATIDAMSRFARAERDLVAIRERARADAEAGVDEERRRGRRFADGGHGAVRDGGRVDRE